MSEYHKIDTVFKRDPATKHKGLLLGEFSRPEFAYLAENKWAFTEKVDGTNIRVIVDPSSPESVRFGGKTDAAQIPADLANRLMERFLSQRNALVAAFPSGAVLYGEGYGAKIQSGGNYRPDQDLVLFDVRVGKWWLDRAAVESIGAQFGVDVVPLIGRGSLGYMVEMASIGFPSRWGNFVAEGIVARPTTELCGRDGERIITKIKHKDFAQAK